MPDVEQAEWTAYEAEYRMDDEAEYRMDDEADGDDITAAAGERAEHSCAPLHRRRWIRRGANDHGGQLRRADRAWWRGHSQHGVPVRIYPR